MTIFTAFITDSWADSATGTAATISVMAKRSEQQATPALEDNFTIGEGLLENLCGPCAATVSLLRMNGLKIDFLATHPGMEHETTKAICDRIERALQDPSQILRYINNPVIPEFSGRPPVSLMEPGDTVGQDQD